MVGVDQHRRNLPHIPGEPGIWVLIFGDMLIFSTLFILFLYYRGQDAVLYARSAARLNQTFGLLNTLLMLTSSWFVATAVHAARLNRGKATPICFILAFGCGLGFAAVKFFEYGEKIRAGILISTNDFFMYYFTLTAIHFVHVLIGMGVLVYLTKYSWSGPYDAAKILALESGASFWHLVDLLWIVLFALLYLIK